MREIWKPPVGVVSCAKPTMNGRPRDARAYRGGSSAASARFTAFFEDLITRAIALIGIRFDRRNRRISARSSTLNTLPIMKRGSVFTWAVSTDRRNTSLIVWGSCCSRLVVSRRGPVDARSRLNVGGLWSCAPGAGASWPRPASSVCRARARRTGRVATRPTALSGPSGSSRRWMVWRARDQRRYLSQDERVEIADLRRADLSIRQVVHRIDRSLSTISRELRRNGGHDGGYRPFHAHRRAVARWARHHSRRIETNPQLRCLVGELLGQRWSPQPPSPSRSSSATRTRRSNAARTRTPMACCGSTSPADRLSMHDPEHLQTVEDEINTRPRTVLADRAPADLFAALLAWPDQPSLRR